MPISPLARVDPPWNAEVLIRVIIFTVSQLFLKKILDHHLLFYHQCFIVTLGSKPITLVRGSLYMNLHPLFMNRPIGREFCLGMRSHFIN